MRILRTPDERFDGLDAYPWEPRYAEVDDGDGGRLRMHYAADGPENGDVVLCLHGQPTWSYLYRKMIPPLSAAGLRVIAPDLVGFGRSDKPAERGDYTCARHVHWMDGFVRALDLDRVTLVCQDWGGLVGLRVLARDPGRFARVVAANTQLPDAGRFDAAMAQTVRDLLAATPARPPEEVVAKLREDARIGFLYWIKYCAEHPDFRISDAVRLAASGGLDDRQAQAYDAPFPSEAYKQGARQFPSLVPIFPDDPALPENRRAWDVLERFDRPFLTAFSDGDPATAGAHVRFQESVPGARGQKHVTIRGAGHFVQEDAGRELAETVIRFCAQNPLAG